MIALSSLRSASQVFSAVTTGVQRSREAVPSVAEAVVKANNQAPPSGAPTETDSPFNSTRLDVTKMKVQLMERVGKAFGLDMEDFDDAGDMAEAIEGQLMFLDRNAVAAIEKELGLDKLGVSLTDVLDAMKDPGGRGDEKLEAALLEESGRTGEETSSGATRFDDLGLYDAATR